MPNSYDQMQAALNNKASAVNSKLAEKQVFQEVTLADRVAAIQAGTAEYQRQRWASGERMVQELGPDIAAGLSKGTYNLVSGTAQATLEGRKFANPIQAAQSVADIIAGVPESAPEAALRGAWSEADRSINDAFTAKQSLISQYNRDIVAEQTAADSAENQAIYKEAVAAGDNRVGALLAREGRNAVDAAGNLIDNPTNLLDFTVEQVPSLATGLLGRVGTAGRAARIATREALGPATKEAIAAARQKLMNRQLGAVVGTTEGAGAYQSTSNEIMELPLDQFLARYPDAAEQIAAGAPEEQVRAGVARQAAVVAAAIQAPLAGLTSQVAAGFALDPLNLEARAGRGFLARVGTAVTDTIKETGEEAIQSGTGGISSNVGQLAAGAEGIDVLEGVGQQVGEGAVGGGVLASTLSTPSVVAGTAATGGRLLKKGAGKALDAAGKYVDGIQEAMQAEVKAQKDKAAVRRKADATLLDIAISALPEEARPSVVTEPPATDGLLTPETKAKLEVMADGPLTKLGALSQSLVLADQRGSTMEPEEQNTLYMYVTRTARELRAAMKNVEDPEAQKAASRLLNNSLVTALENHVQAMPEAQVQELFDKLPDTVLDEASPIDPQTASYIAQAKEQLYNNPDKMTSEQLNKPVFHSSRMSPQDAKQVAVAKELVKAREQHEAAYQKTAINFPKVKTSDEVRNEILNEGFDTGSAERPSLREYTRDISSMVAAGDVGAAAVKMQGLVEFASHFAARAAGFDETAKQALREGKLNEFLDVTFAGETGALDESGRLDRNRRYKLKMSSDGSRATIDHVFADSNLVNATYNTLARQFPELGFPADGAENLAPTWQKQSPTAPKEIVPDAPVAAAPTPVAAEPVAAAEPVEPATAAPVPEEESPAPAVAEDTGTPAEERAPEVEPGQIVSRLTPAEMQNLKRMSYEKLEELVMGWQDMKQSKHTPSSLHRAAVYEQELNSREVPIDSNPDSEARVAAREENPEPDMIDDNFEEEVVDDQAEVRAANEAAEKEALEEEEAALAAEEEQAEEEADALIQESTITEDEDAPLAQRNLGLIPTTIEIIAKDTPGEVAFSATNKFLTSFRTKKNSRSLFALLPDTGKHLREILIKALHEDKPEETLKGLYTEDRAYLVNNLSGDQVGSLTALLGMLPQQISSRMNELLYLKATGRDPQGNVRTVNGKVAKGFLHNLINHPEKNIWMYPNQLSLHMAVWGTNSEGENFIEYQPNIAEAVSLAAVNWIVKTINAPVQYDEDALLRQYKNGLPEHLREAYKSQHSAVPMAQNLARDIQDMLGIRPDDSMSQTYTDGLMKALAADVMNTLGNMGIIVQDNVRIYPGNPANENTIPFFTFNKEVTTERFSEMKTANHYSLQRYADGLKNPAIITGMLLPDATTSPVIGVKPTTADTRLTGTNSKASTDQQEAMLKMSQIPHTVNQPLQEDLQRLGRDNYLWLRGFDALADGDDDHLSNRMHLRSRRGRNRGLLSGWNAVQEIFDSARRWAQDTDANVSEAEIFYPTRMITNTRLMMNASYSPQSNKDMRELVNPGEVTIDLTDRTTEQEYLLAVAQALEIGKVTKVKVDQMTNAEAVRITVSELSNPEGPYHKVLQLIRKHRADPDNEALSDDLGRAFADAFADGDPTSNPITAHALHAMFDYASYQYTQEFGDPTQFTTRLAFEHDGRTNGPIHALLHMGLKYFSAKTLRQLRQGGILLNNAENSVNELKGLGDLYRNVGARMSDNLRAQIGEAQKKGEHPMLLKLEASISLLQRAKHIELPDGGDLTSLKVTRAPGKASLMPAVYGSGKGSIVRKLVMSILDQIYAEMSEAIRNDEPLSEETQNQLHMLMRNFKDKKTGDWVKAKKLDLSDVTTYQQFVFDNTQVQALIDNMTVTAGDALWKAIEAELGGVLDTFSKLYAASGLQLLHFRNEFMKRRENLIKQRVNEGKMLPRDALSKADERRIADELIELQPVYQLYHSAGQAKDHGINIANRENGQHRYNGELIKIKSILDGALSMNINATVIPDASVRIAALLVQGLGDATMMTEIAKNNPNGTLLVFDGWETMPGSLKARAKEVNLATFKSWQYNGMEAVVSSYDSMTATFDELYEADPGSLEKVLAGLVDSDFKEYVAGELVWVQPKAMRQAFSLLPVELGMISDQVQAYKDVLFGGDFRVVADHMAGAQGAHIIEAEVIPDEEFIEQVNRRFVIRFGELQDARQERESTARHVRPMKKAAEPVVADLLPETSSDEESISMTARVTMWTRDQLLKKIDSKKFGNRLHDTVFKIIAKGLPEDLNVVFGSPEEVSLAQAQMYPDSDFTEAHDGAFVGSTIFLTTGKDGVLIHELVHAATLNLVRRYFAGDKTLTAAQQDAGKNLLTLTEEFLQLDLQEADHIHVQDVLTKLMYDGRTADAVNEFMAWTLTDRPLARTLMKTPASTKIKAMATRALNAIRKLLGLPANQNVDTFLAQVMNQTMRLLLRPDTQDSAVIDGETVFHALQAPNGADHNKHLDKVFEEFLRLQQQMPRTPANMEKALASREKAKKILTGFQDANLRMTDKEAHLFEMIQAVFATGMELDSGLLTQMHDLQQAVIKELDYTVFMDDPDSTSQWEHAQAQQIDAAMRGTDATLFFDKAQRSNALANFVAMAMVNQPLRRALAKHKLAVDKSGDKTLNGQLRNGATRIFDWLARHAAHVPDNTSTRDAMDILVLRLADQQAAAQKRVARAPNVIDNLETKLKGALDRGALAAGDLANRRELAGKDKAANAIVNTILHSFQTLTNDEVAGNKAQALVDMVNTSVLPKPARDLITEFIGSLESSYPINALLDKAKYTVSRVRQRLRDEAPGQVRALFQKELPEATWKLLMRTVARTNMQAIRAYQMRVLATFLTDEASLVQEIDKLESQLAEEHRNAWSLGAQDLANWMNGARDNHSPLLRRNAQALALRLGETDVTVTAEQERVAQPILERLIALRAMQGLGEVERGKLAQLMQEDTKGMRALLTLLAAMNQRELQKEGADKQMWNRWAGYIPRATDPRSNLVLADAARGEELVKQGYTWVAPYRADADDPDMDGMGYYANKFSVGRVEISIGGQATFNQGVLQTVEGTLGGVDRLTGRTIDARVQTVIKGGKALPYLIGTKDAQMFSRTAANQRHHALLPIFITEGEYAGQVAGFERAVDQQVLDAHMRADDDLSKAIGIWMGRQAEETFALEVNEQLAGLLKKTWLEGKDANHGKDFVNIAAAPDKATQGAWEAIPREMQKLLRRTFGGPVMVRKDMVNNAIGNRSASIADVFTGMTDLPEEAQKAIETAALGLLGKNAYAKLVAAERVWQALVGSAKDWIVVRSGIVVLANAVSNQFQLLMHDIPPSQLFKLQATKLREVETHLRNERRLAQISVELAASNSVADRVRLEREQRAIRDIESRLTIMPLIAAGQLPSITEGLTEQDEYNLVNDFVGWVENKTKDMPKGLMTAAKVLTISKDTALYQGLNRSIQFGDFVAKAALYEHLTKTKGMDDRAAMARVSERFVNYNINPGRTRDYLESMGLTWFMNYKIRIQKVAFATLRENPLKMFMAGAGADWFGADSLVSSNVFGQNWAYAMGPGQFWKAHEMLLWNQLM